MIFQRVVTRSSHRPGCAAPIVIGPVEVRYAVLGFSRGNATAEFSRSDADRGGFSSECDHRLPGRDQHVCQRWGVSVSVHLVWQGLSGWLATSHPSEFGLQVDQG
jgi:hypothetical protein